MKISRTLGAKFKGCPFKPKVLKQGVSLGQNFLGKLVHHRTYQDITDEDARYCNFQMWS